MKINRFISNSLLEADVEFDISFETQSVEPGHFDGDMDEYTGPILIDESEMVGRIMPILERVLFEEPEGGFNALRKIINEYGYGTVGLVIDEGIEIRPEEAPEALNPRIYCTVRFMNIELTLGNLGTLTAK